MARGGAEKELGEDLGDRLRGGARGRAGEQGEWLGEGLRGVAREELRGAESKRWGGVGEWLHLQRLLEQMKIVSQSPNVSHYGREPLYKPV